MSKEFFKLTWWRIIFIVLIYVLITMWFWGGVDIMANLEEPRLIFTLLFLFIILPLLVSYLIVCVLRWVLFSEETSQKRFSKLALFLKLNKYPKRIFLMPFLMIPLTYILFWIIVFVYVIITGRGSLISEHSGLGMAILGLLVSLIVFFILFISSMRWYYRYKKNQ